MEEGTKREGRALHVNCCDPLIPRQSCHFKKWSNIINGGLRGLTSCSNSPVPRPSHHYGRPSSIKIQSLLWLVWLRRATGQRRGSDPLLPLPGSPQRLEQVFGPRQGLVTNLRVIQSQSWTLKMVFVFTVPLVSIGRDSCQTMVRRSMQNMTHADWNMFIWEKETHIFRFTVGYVRSTPSSCICNESKKHPHLGY